MTREHPTDWSLSISSLSHRSGQTLMVDTTMPAPSGIGDDIVGIQEGAPITITARLESLSSGLLFTGTVSADLTGQCTRCLTDVEDTLDLPVSAFFSYQDQGERKADKEAEEEIEVTDLDENSQDVYSLDPSASLINLESLLRDNLVQALPLQLLCKPDCLGLCSQCGINLNDNPDHHHQVTDLRWAGLEAFKQQLGKETSGKD